MATQLRSSSRIQVTVEINGSCYGPEWNLGNLVKQSNEEALQCLRNRLHEVGVKIIGEPKCLVHTVVEER